MKTCRLCGQDKKEGEFYAHPNTRDGLEGQCKDCKKAQTKNEYWRDPEKSRQKDRDYYHNRKQKT